MKKALQIARLELSILFFSPVAWLVLIVFTIQSGLTFTEMLGAKETSQQLGDNLQSLTQDLFAGSSGFFTTVRKNFYSYIPLLTMGLLSRETSSGSIKLLLSSPVTVWQIVWGKYLSMLGYGLLLIAVLLLIVFIASFSIQNLDIGYVMGALFGLYLLLGAYSAIGLYMSSLSNYQVVAAISTLAVLAGLNFIGQVGRSIDVLRDVTYWISIEGRTANAIKGLISSKDVLYFLLVIFLFLSLTTMKLNAGRVIRTAGAQAGRYVILVAGVIIAGYFSSLPLFTKYRDTTRFNTQTYTKQSLDIIRKLDKSVKLTTYVNLLGNIVHVGSPKFRNFDLSNFEQLRRYLPRLKMDYVYYYDTSAVTRLDPKLSLEANAQRAATAYGFDFSKVLRPEEVRKVIDLSGEGNLYVRILQYGDRSTPLRMFNDMDAYPGEAEIMAAFKRLITKPALIGILGSNDERSVHREGDKDYKDLINTLTTRGAQINQGARIADVDLNGPDPIPTNLDVLIIADPIAPYTASQVRKIRQYIAAGGNALLAAEPHRQPTLNRLLDGLGVWFREGILLQESKKFEADLIQARFAAHLDQSEFKRTQDPVVTMPGAVGLAFSDSGDFRKKVILETDGRCTWNRLTPVNLKTDPVSFDPSTEHKASIPVAVSLTRHLPQKEQRILLAGDADFLSNAELGRFNVRTGNYELAMQLLKWFSRGEYAVDTTRPKPLDNRIRVSKEQLAAVRTLLAIFLPALLAAGGALIIIRRKRK